MLIVTPGPESALLEGGGEGVDANQVGQREGPSGLGLPRPQTCLPPYQGLGRVSPDSDRTVHSRTWTGWILRAMGTLETLLLSALLLSPADAQQGRAPNLWGRGGRMGRGDGLGHRLTISRFDEKPKPPRGVGRQKRNGVRPLFEAASLTPPLPLGLPPHP